MPEKPKGFCARRGCPNRSHGLCADCQRGRNRQKDSYRGSRHQRGYTNRWSAYSKRRLAEYPWCVGYPAGVHGTPSVLATCTDHVKPASSHPELFWEPSNHASLCDDCNKRKAIAEEGGFGRPRAGTT